MSPAPSRDFDLAVIGNGVAGLTAAAQAAERGLSVACIGEGLPGGLIANIGQVDGFPAPLSGAELAQNMVAGCQALNVALLDERVSALEPAAGSTTLRTGHGAIVARSVIVASGASLRKLGVPGEAELEGRGVSQCDWCDGGFFKNQPVLVAGGGDAAFQAALHLATLCESVTLVLRGPAPRARRRYVEAAADNERIAFRWETTVERILGRGGVEGALLRDLADGSVAEQPAAGIFVFIGTEPNSGFLPASVQRDGNQCVVTDAGYRTSTPGIYAIGAVRSGYSGQLLSACGEGAAAAILACAALQQQE